MKQVIEQIDLWNDHKPSQALDPFIYFNPKDKTLMYDKVIIAPNLIGNYKISVGNEDFEDFISPEFNGGVIFLKKGKPIRLYLCHVNDVVTKSIGQKFSTKYILDLFNSKEVVGETGKTLSNLLLSQDVRVEVDNNIHSKHVAKQQYADKTDPAFESADQLVILQEPTFLNSVDDWESIAFYADVKSVLSIEGDDFDIEIQHQGLIAGVKKNQKNLSEQLQGRKAYAIALQTHDKQEYKKMVEYTQDFISKVNAKAKTEQSSDIDLRDGVLEK